MRSSHLLPEHIYNSITAMGFSPMFTFQLTTLRGKHYRHPIAVMGVVDTFGHSILMFQTKYDGSPERIITELLLKR